MTKGEGMAEHCVGFLNVDGTDVRHSACVWADNEKVCEIPRNLHMDLHLFTLKKERSSVEENVISLVFATANPDTREVVSRLPYVVNEKPYSEYSEKQLSVKLGVKKGRVPEPFVKRIRDIIDEARTEG
jgi:hypothetical protein